MNFTLIVHVVSKKRTHVNKGHIHVYIPGAGADNSWTKKIKTKNLLLLWSIAARIFLINYFVTFLHSNVRTTNMTLH